MSPTQASIWSFLKEHYAGLENAAPRAAILTRYNLIHRSDISDRDFREAVSQLVTIFKKPICTSPAKGYFVARTEREKQEALNYLDSVLTEVSDRRRALAETDPLERQESLF
ncbi:MAG TPA: hypothetical protein VNO43_12635 [Candidatus Eisenbacteria bacterium]|nr:hypothetical protein [Candidatus Eisenbacteria bacterium]